MNRGFATHAGYLMGAEQYMNGDNEGSVHDCPGTPKDCVKGMGAARLTRLMVVVLRCRPAC